MDVESAMSSKLVCRVCGAGEGNCQRCPCPSNREEKLNFRIPGLPGGKAATPSDVDPETLFDPNEDEADDPSFLGYRVNCIEGVEDCVCIGRSDRFAGPMDGGFASAGYVGTSAGVVHTFHMVGTGLFEGFALGKGLAGWFVEYSSLLSRFSQTTPNLSQPGFNDDRVCVSGTGKEIGGREGRKAACIDGDDVRLA